MAPGSCVRFKQLFPYAALLNVTESVSVLLRTFPSPLYTALRPLHPLAPSPPPASHARVYLVQGFADSNNNN